MAAISPVCENCGELNLEQLLQAPYHSTAGKYLNAGAHRAAIAELQAHIRRHKKILEALQKQEAELNEELSRLVYPVLTLPPEIVSNIFVACLPSPRRTRPSRRSVPLVLAQICSLWRDIALGTCALWAWHDLQLSYSSTGNGLRPLLDAWILRAKGHPLSLTLRSQQKIPAKILSVIPSLTGRLRYLELNLIPSEHGHFQVSLPSLHHLAIVGSLTLDDLNRFLRNTPALHELRLPGFSLPALTTKEIIFAPLPFLTTLEIHIAPAETILRILTNCSALTDLKCTVKGKTYEMPPPVSFPALRSLSVMGPACGFLRHFKLPNLIQLTVDEDVDEVRSLVMRSGCQLLHLVCSAQSWEPRELRWWLDIFASVVRLEMNVGPQVNVLLTHLLSRRQGGSSLYRVPNLLDLVVTTSAIDIDYELVVALLPARPDCERLRTFRIIIDQRYEENTRHKRFFRGCPGPLAAAQLTAACNFALKFVLRNPHGAEYSMWDKQTGAIVHDTNL
ncbi:hypothetical protein C8R46DRAFT_1346935 [Mycena filopes]|nr:hypothetical protein C8R46DRAFT_1346935 [Mycena filopes]